MGRVRTLLAFAGVWHIDDEFYKTYRALRVEIDGAKMLTRQAFFKVIEKALSFPRSCAGSAEVYFELISDLSWLDYRIVVVTIRNSDDFLIRDIGFRDTVLYDHRRNNIIPLDCCENENIDMEDESLVLLWNLVDEGLLAEHDRAKKPYLYSWFNWVCAGFLNKR